MGDASKINNSSLVHFLDYLRVLICSVSVEKNPQNRMLGWRKFVDGKVIIFWSNLYICVKYFWQVICDFVWSLARTLCMEDIQGSLWWSHVYWFCITSIWCWTCKSTHARGLWLECILNKSFWQLELFSFSRLIYFWLSWYSSDRAPGLGFMDQTALSGLWPWRSVWHFLQPCFTLCKSVLSFDNLKWIICSNFV